MADRQVRVGETERQQIAAAGSIYPVLKRGAAQAAFAGKCALAVMAKAPRAGRVKTRLSPPLTLEQSAALNVCFLRDTARNIADVASEGSAVGLGCYTPAGDETLFDSLLPDGFALIAQRGEGFGNRLLAAAQDILSCGFAAVCLIDSDSPTIPPEALRSAVRELTCGDADGHVVLGGSTDGGYYLIGMREPHELPFHCISWSTSSVHEETLERCAEAALEVVALPQWYDVDDAATLALLEAELLDAQVPAFATVSGYDAAATREFLRARRCGLLDEPSTDEVVA